VDISQKGKGDKILELVSELYQEEDASIADIELKALDPKIRKGQLED